MMKKSVEKLLCLVLIAQGEGLMQEFDSIRKKYERMDAASFNDDNLYKERTNEVRLHPSC
jgi:hypothetical protein